MHDRCKSADARRNASTLCLPLNARIWCWCTCLLVLFLVFADGLLTGSDPVVNTKWGLIRGKWSRSLRNRQVANFLGLPYALPPVGDLRFKSPQPWNRTWTSIRDATVDGKKCIQFENFIFGSEDCLYLNVFVPVISDNQDSEKLPILFFVHGGAYIIGSSDSKFLAPDYLLDHDVILVTFNYRLGPLEDLVTCDRFLGFFSTGNQASPGNYGLKDMVMALKWVQENIRSFGGDPKSVTIMGSSAGAASVQLLAFSKKTEGLFNKYIMLSGNALPSWTNHNRRIYRQICLELARLVGCLPELEDVVMSNKTILEIIVENERKRNVDASKHCENLGNVKNDEGMMECLRSVDASRLIKMTPHFNVWKNNPMAVFGPVIEQDSEDAIMTMHPFKVLKNGLFRDIPAIMQVANDEGLLKTADFFAEPDMEREFIENFERYLPYMVENYEDVTSIPNYIAAIKNFYFNGNLTLGITNNLTKVISDAPLMWPMIRAARYLSEKGKAKVYFSLFAYEGTFSYTFSTGFTVHLGVCHSDEMNYLFPVLNNKYRDLQLHNTESDFTMINIMTEMWANFVTHGVPRAWQIPAWPDYRDHHHFMRFGIGSSPDIVVQADFLSDRMEFWDKLSANVSMESECGIFVDDSQMDITSGTANTVDRLKLIILIKLLDVNSIYVAQIICMCIGKIWNTYGFDRHLWLETYLQFNALSAEVGSLAAVKSNDDSKYEAKPFPFTS